MHRSMARLSKIKGAGSSRRRARTATETATGSSSSKHPTHVEAVGSTTARGAAVDWNDGRGEIRSPVGSLANPREARGRPDDVAQHPGDRPLDGRIGEPAHEGGCGHRQHRVGNKPRSGKAEAGGAP